MGGSPKSPGIIPLVVQEMFRRQASLTRYTAELNISYLELYKEEPFDLLVERAKAPKLSIRTGQDGTQFVANQTSEPIAHVEAFNKIYEWVIHSIILPPWV